MLKLNDLFCLSRLRNALNDPGRSCDLTRQPGMSITEQQHLRYRTIPLSVLFVRVNIHLIAIHASHLDDNPLRTGLIGTTSSYRQACCAIAAKKHLELSHSKLGFADHLYRSHCSDTSGKALVSVHHILQPIHLAR